jgi:hypothetical protein
MSRKLYEFTCAECGQRYRSLSKRTICSLCYMASPEFATRHNRHSHKKLDSPEKPTICKKCGAELTDEGERRIQLCGACLDKRKHEYDDLIKRARELKSRRTEVVTASDVPSFDERRII